MKKILLAGMIGILITTAVGCGKQQAEKTNAPGTAAPKVESKQTVDAFGLVKAMDIRNINIDFPALVEKINVREGQRVKQGDLLATLNMKEFEAQIRSKELDLNSNQSEVSRLQSYYLNSNNNPQLQKYLNALKNAEDLYTKAMDDLKSKQILFDAGSISKSELDEAKKAADAKKKDVDDIKYDIDTLKFDKKTEVDPKLSKTAMLDTDIRVMKDKLNKSYLKNNEVIADVPTGVVYDIGYVQGDKIDTEKKLLSILNLESLIVQADVSEEFIKDIKLGSEVTIIPQADKSKQYKGKVLRISNKAVEKNGETDIPVEISIDNRDDFLLPEFNVDVKISTEQKK